MNTRNERIIAAKHLAIEMLPAQNAADIGLHKALAGRQRTRAARAGLRQQMAERELLRDGCWRKR